MLTLNEAKAIYVYPGATDMRYGINALYSLAEQPEEKTMHVFCGKDRRVIKVLMADEGCVYLLQKRLTTGKFVWPETGAISLVDAMQLAQIIDGMTVVRRIEDGGTIRKRLIA